MMEDAAEDRVDGLKHLWRAFRCSRNALKAAVKNEAAIRHELMFGVVHFIALALVPAPIIFRFILIALWVQLIVVELINTAIETVVDLVSPDYHPLAGLAKDYGSAAVFLSLVLIVAAWLVVAIFMIYIGA